MVSSSLMLGPASVAEKYMNDAKTILMIPIVELLPVACIRQKRSGNRSSPSEPAKVNTRPMSNSTLTIAVINDRPSRQILRQGHRAQE